MSRIKNAVLKVRTSLFKGAFVHNPVLTQATGIFAIVCGAISLRYGIALTLTLGATLLLCEAVAVLLLKALPRWLRVAFYALIGAGVVYALDPFIGIISSGGTRALPLCFCLMGVNALIAVRCERFAVKSKLRYCMVDAFSTTAGFGAVAIAVGLINEFAVGRLTDIPAGRLPFIAFLVLGFIAAVHKAVIKKFYPEEQSDTFSMRSSTDKIVFRDPGLGKKKTNKAASGFSEDYDIINLRGAERESE